MGKAEERERREALGWARLGDRLGWKSKVASEARAKASKSTLLNSADRAADGLGGRPNPRWCKRHKRRFLRHFLNGKYSAPLSGRGQAVWGSRKGRMDPRSGPHARGTPIGVPGGTLVSSMCRKSMGVRSGPWKGARKQERSRDESQPVSMAGDPSPSGNRDVTQPDG